jgi:hypothetical protein
LVNVELSAGNINPGTRIVGVRCWFLDAATIAPRVMAAPKTATCFARIRKFLVKPALTAAHAFQRRVQVNSSGVAESMASARLVLTGSIRPQS